MSADKRIQPVRRAMLHIGRKYSYEQLVFRLRGGGEVTREVVRHPGAAAILPLLAPGECLPSGQRADCPQVVFIHNYRVAAEKELWELPAGTLEIGEDPAVCAGRELEEETGYRAASIERLGSFYTSPGMSDELMHTFLARGLTYVGQHLEADEDITVHPFPVPEALAMATDGRVMDGKSITTLLLAQRRGLLG